MDYAKSIDVRGLCCAQPIIALARELKGMASGEVLQVLADKDSMRKDVPAFCRQTGHILLESEERDGLLHFWVRRA
ncbi:sulfurtransferase TusA family protein [Acidiferrobacter sp.]|jgi:tRNA 2-thiouridine synthesizing protein A|uniref:sulfurtransferase TusA family protein n=1 Tax=Acidiferrobacter sp. TaxID=1872107 RepID=UPI0026256DEA|nr:sulfurtransferase TusA family protein [Acidiferrobacter sp.]